MTLKVSIITVCLNSAATIRDTIESIVAQDYPAIEYLVLDGGSTDGTLDIVRSYGDCIARLVSEPDRGMYDSMNKGLELASGDIVGFLHSDDMLATPTTISRVVRAMEQTGAECVYGDIEMVSTSDPQRVVRRWRSRPHSAGSLPRGWYPPHVTLYVRRSVLQEIGPFDERYRIAADMDHMVRLFEVRGVHSVHLPEVLVRMRVGGASNKSLRNIWRANIETWQSLRRHGFRVGPWFIAAKLLRKVRQLTIRPNAD
jgi:glycosyltransferase involved in cell wall biosynthesis